MARRSMEVRAGLVVGDWVSGLAQWDLYQTLTYDPRRGHDRTGQESADPVAPSFWSTRRHVERFIVDAENTLERSVVAVLGLERQRNGWPHWHALFGAGGVSSAEFTQLSASWFKAHGFARFDRVDRDDTRAIAAYVGKYLTKTASELLIYGPKQGRALAGQAFLPGQAPRGGWLKSPF